MDTAEAASALHLATLAKEQGFVISIASANSIKVSKKNRTIFYVKGKRASELIASAKEEAKGTPVTDKEYILYKLIDGGKIELGKVEYRAGPSQFTPLTAAKKLASIKKDIVDAVIETARVESEKGLIYEHEFKELSDSTVITVEKFNKEWGVYTKPIDNLGLLGKVELKAQQAQGLKPQAGDNISDLGVYARYWEGLNTAVVNYVPSREPAVELPSEDIAEGWMSPSPIGGSLIEFTTAEHMSEVEYIGPKDDIERCAASASTMTQSEWCKVCPGRINGTCVYATGYRPDGTKIVRIYSSHAHLFRLRPKVDMSKDVAVGWASSVPTVEVGDLVNDDAGSYAVVQAIGKLDGFGSKDTMWGIWKDTPDDAIYEYKNKPVPKVKSRGGDSETMNLSFVTIVKKNVINNVELPAEDITEGWAADNMEESTMQETRISVFPERGATPLLFRSPNTKWIMVAVLAAAVFGGVFAYKKFKTQ